MIEGIQPRPALLRHSTGELLAAIAMAVSIVFAPSSPSAVTSCLMCNLSTRTSTRNLSTRRPSTWLPRPWPVAAPSAADEMFAKLQKLAEFRDEGILTEEEFTAQKAKLLSLRERPATTDHRRHLTMQFLNRERRMGSTLEGMRYG